MTATTKAVLFDFGGTLDADGVHWLDRFLSIYAQEGLRVDREAFARAFYDADDNLPARFALDGLDLEQTIRLQAGCVVENLAAAAPGAAGPGLAERVVRRFVDSARAHLRRNRPLLERLRRSFRLGIVSNFYGNLDSILAAEGLADLFGAVADSERVGAMKPDAKIFLHATRGLGVEPAESLMVGDSVPRDMKGAEGLGMPHAWVAGGRDASETCCAAAPVLRTLSDLEPLLFGSGRRVDA
ncbi:MAG: HAD family hydrolase [Elusimicrobiota bacterium]